MPRFSLTISDLDERQLAALAAACADLPDDADDGDDTGEDSPTTDTTDAPAPKTRKKRVKKAKPATLPANTGSPAPVPAAAPAAPATTSADPQPVTTSAAPEAAPAAPAPAPAAPAATGPTMESLIAKARTLGTGPLGQTALLAVLNAMAVNSLPKVPEAQYPALDALLDASIAYSGTPAPTKDWFKAVCQTGQYEAATAALTEAVNAAMGL